MRTSVLRSAGFDVVPCSTIESLLTVLRAESAVDAVIFGRGDAAVVDRALELARANTGAPLIQFQSRLTAEPMFDLLIAPQTPPQTWLRAISDLILRSRDAHFATEPQQPVDCSAIDSAFPGTVDAPPPIVQGGVHDWHAVALSIARKPAAKPAEANEPNVAAEGSARQI